MHQPTLCAVTIASVSAASTIENIVSLVPPSRRDQKILDGTQYYGDARAQPERRGKILEIIWHISQT
jgi:hypothetical protein